jgi:RND family efflux transporter MFP subunit
MLPEVKSSTVTHRGLYIAGTAMMTVAATIVITGIMTRKSADAKLIEWTQTRSVPVVAVSYPDTHPGRATLDLPGRLDAYNQAALYARVSGYLKGWYADIGTKVKAGQLLAEIDAPDLDQQLSQAQANLVSARANAKLSDVTLSRGQQLVPSGYISKQDLDQRAADAANKQGLVQSAAANLERLQVLEQYKRITAPFDGLVTARTTDIGHLISVGSNGPALFVVSDISKLRVYVQVPQKYAPSILVGTKAKLRVPEYPNRKFSATVVASAQAVNVASGTTRIELEVDNASGELMTGDFANVSFDLPNPEVAVNVPASALIFDQSGLSLATVDDANRVVLKKVTISRDLGKTIEIGSGITAKDRVISTPPDGIVTGDLVRVAGAPEATGEKQAALVAQ